MASLEHLDLVLGEALERIIEAVQEVRDLAFPDEKGVVRDLGMAINMLWEVREVAYKIKPELKRDFVREIEQDKTRWEELNEIALKAGTAERDGEIDQAVSFFNKLLTTSHFGYFRLLAEAGLYRVSRMQEKKTN